MPGHFMTMQELHVEFIDWEAPLAKTIGFSRGGENYPRYEFDVPPAGPMQIMTRCSPQPLLFLALRTLDWLHTFIIHDSGPYIACEDFWTCACLYIGPQLKKVAIDLTIPCPHVSGEDWNAELIKFMAQSAQRLLRWTLMPLDEEVLDLFSLPQNGPPRWPANLYGSSHSSTLKELCVLLTRDTWSSISLGSRVQARFATHRKLEIRTQDLTAFNDLANGKFMFPQVETFSIDCSSFPSASEVDAFFNALQDLFSPSRLQCLSMETSPWEDQWRSNTISSCGGTLRRDHLRKLLAFRRNHPPERLDLKWVLIDEHVSEVATLLGKLLPNLKIDTNISGDFKNELKSTLEGPTEDEADTPSEA
ncbi:predicted protein [Postia placenta Mad-698-R]|uniref:Uncharacterized protein n=1 Tax=Postia placenta MAD-698-R-SB12 TaxID=670580 RepID=A0A1X6N3P9_9APHY|nr:hypothetical protein POSPLADRAFT_1139974 [Postia placenta MAD-698-R-SB12]EED85846.1 predicted protein [Postia placenta Mad-698-R]OSX63234.1 hypothetical protein POSPLADRAFT_1139974 [Postia placenta MAD-698-R-SB12]